MSLTRHALTFLVVVATLSVSDRALAQDGPLYFVVTNDGSQYQGQLVENVVGQHVTIRLASGEIRTFPAADVRSQGNVAPATPPPPLPQTLTTSLAQLLPPGSPGAPPVRYDGPDAVQVHITKANNGEGSLLMESASGWERVCTMPCTTSVDPKIDYKLYDSDPFRFPAGPPLDLVANGSGRRTLQSVGWTLVTVSLLAWIPGLLFQVGVFDSGDSSARTPAEQAHTQSSDNVAAGLIYGAAGAMLVAGIVLLVVHPSPSLSTSDGLRRIVKRGGIPLGDDLTLTPTGLSF